MTDSEKKLTPYGALFETESKTSTPRLSMTPAMKSLAAVAAVTAGGSIAPAIASETADHFTRSADATSSVVASARMALANDDPARATEILAPAYEANPRDVDVLSILGEISLFAGQLEAGLHYFQTALAEDAGNIPALRGAVTVLIEQREQFSALALIDRATSAQANQRELQSLKVAVYSTPGNPLKEREVIKSALFLS